MIFDSLTLHNYGLYKGEHQFALSSKDERRNITLFGGLNGAGKTTFLEALQVALYGKLAPFVQGYSQAYEQVLADRINRQVNPRDGASVELSFRVQEDGKQRSYTVHRSWAGKRGRAKEHLQVYIDGEYDEVLTETWTEHAERFIPARLAPLFFFDGEKIEALADPERSTQAIRTAMEALLGLDIVTQLEADLATLEKRKLKAAGTNGSGPGIDDSAIKKLEDEYVAKHQTLQALKQKASGFQNEADAVEKRLKKIQGDLSSQGGDAFEGRKEIEARFDAAKEELAGNEAQLREIACGDLPLFLVINKLQSIHQQGRAAIESQRQQVIADFVREHDKRLLEFLNEAPEANNKFRKSVGAFLKAEFNTHFGSDNRKADVIAIDQDVVDRVVHLLRQLPVEEKAARRLLNDHEKLVQKAHTMERTLATIPEEDAIASLLNEREELRIKQAEVKVHLSMVETEVAQAEKQVGNLRDQIERELNKRNDALKEGSKEARVIDHARRAMKTLGVFRRRLLEKHAERIAQLVQESFSHLIRKETLTSEIQIDSETCKLVLFDGDGEVLPPDRLSAGERQLLAVSLLWGLARAAGRPLPIVVDTPLGRLDGSHRINLVSRYFPHASHQVIVLSTDEEIDVGLLEHLRPYIAHSYLLEYREDRKHSTVREGYFAEAEVVL